MKRLILHLPRIESVPGGAERLPPQMRGLLARARRFERGASDPLAELLGCPALPGPAALSRLAAPDADDAAQGSYWLRFDPVRLVPDLAAVWLEGKLPIDFASPQLEALVADLQAMFADEGLAWQPGAGRDHGLLELSEAPECRFHALDDARGARLDEVLPSGPDAARWCRLINQSQMVFHQYRSMDRGDQHGAGLWFWGGGALPGRRAADPGLRVVDAAGDDTVRGLARWLGAAYTAASGSVLDVSESRCYVYWPLVDVDAALTALTDQWLVPAGRMLRRGRLAELAVIGSSGHWRLGRPGSFASWRRAPRGLDAPEGAD